jgi:hypothetical protein
MTNNNRIRNGLYIEGGTKRWYLNGELHRVDGPACEYSDGYKSWYLNNQLVYSKKVNNIHLHNNLSESFKQSIIKYKLKLINT